MSGIFDQIINYSPPLIVSGTVNYKGTWNASTNNPPLSNPPVASTKGDYYVVSTAGTQFSITFGVGDWIISNGTAWEKVDLTDAVSSVFGRTGAVVGDSTDYSAVGLTNTAIGAANPSTGAFTSLSSSSTTTLNGTTIPASKTLVVTTDKLSALAATTSAELAGVISDETGSGSLVFANSPTLVTPALGTPSSGTVTNLTGTASININGTVGATTPSTGAFTTLGATGDVTASGGNILNTSGGPIPIRVSGATTGSAVARFGNTGGDSFFGAEGNATNNLIVGCTAYDTIVRGPSGIAFSANSGSSMQMRLSSTGLAVTGALSATGNADFGATASSARITLGHVTNTVVDNSFILRTGSTKTAWLIGAQFSQDNGLEITPSTTVGGTTFSTPKLVINSTGLAVTGALSSTTGANFATSSGDVVIGNATAAAKLHIQADFSSSYGATVRTTSNASNANLIQFVKDAAGSPNEVGNITYTNATNLTNYNTTSDARLKDNVRELTNSGNIIDGLRPVLHDWKTGQKNIIGFIAQEVFAVFPQAVSKGDDDLETVTQQWSMDASKLIPVLVAELKSVRARLAALESK